MTFREIDENSRGSELDKEEPGETEVSHRSCDDEAAERQRSQLSAPAKGNKGFARNRRSLCFDSKPILEFTQNQIVSIHGQNKFGQKKPWNILFQGDKWLFIFMSHINYIRYA